MPRDGEVIRAGGHRPSLFGSGAEAVIWQAQDASVLGEMWQRADQPIDQVMAYRPGGDGGGDG
jgi:hypothetical protein